MSSSPAQESIEVEFLTAVQSITARVETGRRRLSDILNYPGDDFIELSGVRMVRLDGKEEAAMTGDFARINKNSLLVIFPREEPADVERSIKPPLEFVPKERHPVLISLPPFLINGDIYLVKDIDLRRSRMEALPPFLPLSDPRVLYQPNPRKSWSNPFAIINRSKVEILLPAPEANP